MNQDQRLIDIANRMAQLREMEQDIDPDAFKDTMEGLNYELERKVEACVHVLEEYEREAIRMEGIAMEYENRIDRVRRNADYLRGYIQGELMASGAKKVETPELLVRIQSYAKVLITDKDQVPTQLMRKYPPKTTQQPDAPDKEAIMTQLKAGEEVPGCALDYTHKMTIKHRQPAEEESSGESE